MPELKKEFPFLIGADPEFTVLLGQKKADAEAVVKALFKGSGYTPASMGYKIKDKGNIGWDGCSSTGEIRPSPSNDPQVVIDNIAEAFKAMTKDVGIFDYSTHSAKAPVGGHLHLDMPATFNAKKAMIDKIHRCLSAFYLPLMLCDDVNSLNIRSQGGRGGYGRMDDYRISNFGTSEAPRYTYEFRVPSAEWLTTPKIAKATLAYMATVYHEILKDPNKFQRDHKNVWSSKEQGNAIQGCLLSEYTLPLVGLIKAVKNAVRTFDYYPVYKDEIEYLFHPDKVLNDKKKINFNIAEGWNLGNKCPTKRQLLATKLSGKKTTGLDFDAFSPSIYIPYNSDTNVESFVTELKKRIISLGWKLKNSYYPFGVRRGVSDFIIFNKASEIIYDGGQIKTTGDAKTIEDIIGRIAPRFTVDSGIKGTEKEALLRKHILIGIPYNMRMENFTRGFIEKVYELENGKYEPKKMKVTDLKDELTDGVIYKTYHTETDPAPKVEATMPTEFMTVTESRYTLVDAQDADSERVIN